MCGICGYISKNRITIDDLTKMNNTITHRGPNDSGVEIYDGKNGYNIGFAQRRLSILDLSELGHQPMHSKDHRISVVYNGECYNFLELKEELSDYQFKSNCDTEVIIAAYLKWGIKCVDKLKGMFAIAIYDRETEEVFLVRDRIGKKPLYYSYEDGNIIFGSELKPIMAAPRFEGSINKEIIKKYMFHYYIQAPNTIFEHVYKLEPGSILRFKDGNITIEKYWDIATQYNELSKHQVKSYEEAKSTLKDLLEDAVRKRMIADVPLGAFLSGGYDSSLMTAMAQKIVSEPVKTFSIGFHEEGYNEAKYAKEVANYLGTEHTEHYVSEKDMFEMLHDIATYYDEPFADSSQIPTMLVSKVAKEKVTVALSGDGGDEFFCGYNSYDMVKRAQQLDMLGGVAHTIGNAPGIKQLGLMDRLPSKVRIIANNRNPLTKTQLVSEYYEQALDQMLIHNEGNVRYEIEHRYTAKDWQIKRMLLDMEAYLPGDILCKVDRASMKYSLEARCPILDTDVMEYSFRIPHEYKYNKGNKKHILKDIAYDYIPKEMLERPKVGFAIPRDQWLRGPLKEELLAYSDEKFLKEQGIFHGAYMTSFLQNYFASGDQGRGTGLNYSTIIWSFYMFQKWYHTYQFN